MGSKGAFLFLGLILAIFLIISSEVAAREFAETSNEMNGSNISETKRVGKHLRKGLGKIIKAGKEIFCNRCSTCNGLCGYCCN